MQLQVQYLRALAALAVFYYHIVANLKGSGNDYVPAIYEVGSAGVDLFFVISGYIMAKIIWEKPFNAKNFVNSRIWRIVPLYWSATLFVFLIAAVAPNLLGSTTADIGQLIHSLFFIPNGANPLSNTPTLVIGWTLNYEMFFYALIVICVGFFRDRSLALTAALLCLIALIGQLIHFKNGYMQFYTDLIILEFAFGIAVFHIVRVQGKSLPSYLAYTILIISLAIMQLSTMAEINTHRVLTWGLPAAFALYAGLSALNFNSPLFTKLGDWSYEIYLLHVFIIAGGMKLILPYLNGLNLAGPIKIIIFTTILSVILIIASAITHSFFAYLVPRLRNIPSKR